MKITLPDNSSRELPEGSSGYDLAKDIGPGLAKSAIAVTIDGIQKDLYDIIDSDASASMASCKSLCTPSMVTAIADLARPGPISFARS